LRRNYTRATFPETVTARSSYRRHSSTGAPVLFIVGNEMRVYATFCARGNRREYVDGREFTPRLRKAA